MIAPLDRITVTVSARMYVRWLAGAWHVEAADTLLFLGEWP